MGMEPATWIAVAALVVNAVKECVITYIHYLERKNRNGGQTKAPVDGPTPG